MHCAKSWGSARHSPCTNEIAEVPVSQLRHPIQVVVAYDFSPSAEEALMRAVDVAARAPQHVLHVVCALDPRGSVRHITADQAETVQRQASEHIAAAFAGRATESAVQF